MIDSLRMVDVDREALRARQLEREHLDSGQARLDPLRYLAGQLPFPVVHGRCQRLSFVNVSRCRTEVRHWIKKMGATRPFRRAGENGSRTIANAGLLGRR